MKRTMCELKEIIKRSNEEIRQANEILTSSNVSIMKAIFVASNKRYAKRTLHNVYINLNQIKMREWGK